MRVLLLTVLLAIAASHSIEYLEQISHDDFGKTIIEAIQLEMGQDNGSTVERIIALHQGLASDIQNEQASESNLYQQRQQTLLQRAQEARDRAQLAAQRRAEDEQTIPLKQEELASKQEQLFVKSEEEQRNNDRIAALTQERKQSRAEYEERREELTGLVSALKEAKTIVQQLKTSGFMQMNEHVFAQVKAHQEKFLNSFPKQRGFHKLINVLLITMQDKTLRADQGVVDKIVTIIDELQEAIYGVQRQEMKADDARQQDYLTERARIELINRRLEGTLADAKAQVEILKQRILELTNDINSQQQIFESKTKEAQDWAQTAADAEVAYQRMTNNRKI